jgi:hypothetical protein
MIFSMGGNWMNILIVINDAPYGSEKAYNALRVALSLQKEPPWPPEAKRRYNGNKDF